jgi:hypothetical protein
VSFLQNPVGLAEAPAVFRPTACKTAFFSGCSFKTEVLKEPRVKKQKMKAESGEGDAGNGGFLTDPSSSLFRCLGRKGQHAAIPRPGSREFTGFRDTDKSVMGGGKQGRWGTPEMAGPWGLRRRYGSRPDSGDPAPDHRADWAELF